MQPPRPSAIEAALLYDDYKPFDYEGFARFLQKVFKDKVQVKLGVHEDGAFGVLVVGSSYIMISQNKGPLGPAGFQNAVGSDYMKLHYPEGAEVVQSHAKNIFVTVGSKDITIPREIEDKIAELSPDLALPKSPPPDQSQFESYWLTAQIVTHLLCLMNKPRLIHWIQSDRFVRPQEWAEAVKARSGWPFQVHPILFGDSPPDNEGRHKIGISLFGSEHFTGHHLVVEETIFNFERIIEEIVFEIMAMFHGETELPQSGSTINFKNGASARIHVRRGDNFHPRPYVTLEVLSLAELSESPDINTGPRFGAPSHGSQEPAPSSAHQDITAPIIPPQPTGTPMPFASKAGQSEPLSSDRITQVIEMSPNGPKKLIASKIHPNAPETFGKRSYKDYTPPAKEKRKRGGSLKTIGGFIMAFGLYFGIQNVSQMFGGIGGGMMEARLKPMATDVEEIEVETEAEEPPARNRLNLPQIRN